MAMDFMSRLQLQEYIFVLPDISVTALCQRLTGMISETTRSDSQPWPAKTTYLKKQNAINTH